MFESISEGFREWPRQLGVQEQRCQRKEARSNVNPLWTLVFPSEMLVIWTIIFEHKVVDGAQSSSTRLRRHRPQRPKNTREEETTESTAWNVATIFPCGICQLLSLSQAEWDVKIQLRYQSMKPIFQWSISATETEVEIHDQSR